MLVMLVCVYAAGCSLDRHEKIRGTVISLTVDSEKNTVVIKEAKTGQQKTIIVSADDMKKLQPGLRITARLKKGSNIAESVKIKIVKPKTTEQGSGSGGADGNEQ